jgi:hypothetical protein
MASRNTRAHLRSMSTTKITAESPFRDARVPTSPPHPLLRRALQVLGRLGWRRRSSATSGAPAWASLTFPEGGTRSFLVRELPFSVSCVEGCLWITHGADPGDHILRAGQEFTASGPGHLVLHAFAPSRALFWTYPPVLGRRE